MKFTLNLFLILVVIIGLNACSNSHHDNLPIEERLPYPTAASGPLFDVIRPNIQTFEIIAYKDNVIVGQNGTLVFVPKNSFIDANGEPVKGKINVEMIEILSLEDMVKANLQAIANGSVIQSDGMLYLDAKSEGKQLALANDKKLRVDLPCLDQENATVSVKVFTGNFDARGNINWVMNQSLETKMIPLPLELFNYEHELSHNYQRIAGNVGYTTYLSDYAGNPMEVESVMDVSTLKQKKFENTFIATREFEKRFSIIESVSWDIGRYHSYCTTTDIRGRMVKDLNLLNIYLNNLNKDLWFCDSLAHDYIKSWKIDTLLCPVWKFDQVKVKWMNLFKDLYQQRLTQLIKLPKDIYFSQPDARMKLSDKGYEEPEIDELMGAYHRQIQLIEQRSSKTNAKKLKVNSFAISKLGWISCCALFNGAQSKPFDLSVLALGLTNDDTIAWTMLVHGKRIVLKGIQSDGLKFVFSSKSSPSTKLPMGEKATLIGLSFKNGVPYLGIKEIKITEQSEHSIEMKPGTIPEINNMLKSIPIEPEWPH